MQWSMTIAALSIFGAKTKIALTSVRSRVRESLAKWLILLTLYFLLKLTYVLVKMLFDQQNYDTFDTPGTFL